MRFVKISENFLPPSKILKLSLANPYSDVVPLPQQSRGSLPPTPPEGRGALPLRGLGDGKRERLNEDNAPLRLSDEERVDRSQLQMTNRHTGMAPTNEWAHILNKLNERTN